MRPSTSLSSQANKIRLSKGGMFVVWGILQLVGIVHLSTGNPPFVDGFVLPLHPYPAATTLATTNKRPLFSWPPIPTDEPTTTAPAASRVDHRQQFQDDLQNSRGDAREQVAAIRRFQQLAEEVYAQQMVEYRTILDRLAVLTARVSDHHQQQQPQPLHEPHASWQPQQQQQQRHEQEQGYDSESSSCQEAQSFYSEMEQPSRQEGSEEPRSYQEDLHELTGSVEIYGQEQQHLVDQVPYHEQRYEGWEFPDQQPQPDEPPPEVTGVQDYGQLQPTGLGEEQYQAYQEQQFYSPEIEAPSYPTESVELVEKFAPQPPLVVATDISTIEEDTTESDLLIEIDTLTERATELVAEHEQQQQDLQDLSMSSISITSSSQTPPEAAAMLVGVPFQLEEMEDADTCTSEIILNADFTVTVGETDGPIYKKATGTWSAVPITNGDKEFIRDSENSSDDKNNSDKKNNGMLAMSMTLVRHYQAGHEAIEATDVGEFTFAVERNFIGTLTYVGDRLAISGSVLIEDEIFGDEEVGYFNMIDTSPREGDDDDSWKPAKVGRSFRTAA